MLKKWASSAAVATIAAAMLAACSSNSAGPSTSASPSASANAATPTAAAKAKKVVYVYANTGALQLTTDTSKPEAVEEVRQAILAKSGIEVQAIIPPKGSEADKLNLLLASNEPLDIFIGSMSTHQAKGAVMPLNDLLDKYGANVRKLWKSEWASGWKGLTTKDGKIWGVPQVPPLAGNTVLVRKDWLDKYGLAVPKTFDEFENVLKVFKEKDPAGNGQTIPLLTDFNVQNGLQGMNMALAAGFMDVGYANWIDTDGKVKPIVFNPGYKQFIGVMADWYKKGYIYKEAFSLIKDKEIELTKQNRVGAAAIWYTTILNQVSALKQTAPDANYIVVDLQGPKGNVTSSGGVSLGGTMISKNSKNAEAAMELINWAHSDIENYFLAFYGIEGKHWKYVDKANHIIERLNRDYLGDLQIGSSFAYTVQHALNDPASKPANDYIKDYITKTSRMKMPALLDYDYKFDQKAIADKIPTLNDINRMMEQEIVKFVMGARPIGEYDKFLQELSKTGVDNWTQVMTEQYNSVK